MSTLPLIVGVRLLLLLAVCLWHCQASAETIVPGIDRLCQKISEHGSVYTTWRSYYGLDSNRVGEIDISRGISYQVLQADSTRYRHDWRILEGGLNGTVVHHVVTIWDGQRWFSFDAVERTLTTSRQDYRPSSVGIVVPVFAWIAPFSKRFDQDFSATADAPMHGIDYLPVLSDFVDANSREALLQRVRSALSESGTQMDSYWERVDIENPFGLFQRFTTQASSFEGLFAGTWTIQVDLFHGRYRPELSASYPQLPLRCSWAETAGMPYAKRVEYETSQGLYVYDEVECRWGQILDDDIFSIDPALAVRVYDRDSDQFIPIE